MKKAIIVYASTHHGSTRKLVEEIAAHYDIDQIDATQTSCTDLSGYDLIGFASGIDFGKFYPSVEEFLQRNLPENKQVFFLYTCAKTSSRFTETMKKAAISKGAAVLGEYGCKGFNTYGPWKLIGGMNKNHPSEDELREAVQFFASLLD